jgi:hypothetical protein
MAVNDELDRLDRQLTREAAGPVAAMANTAAFSLITSIRRIVDQLTRAARDRPLMALLIPFEVGYVLARAGRKHARG